MIKNIGVLIAILECHLNGKEDIRDMLSCYDISGVNNIVSDLLDCLTKLNYIKSLIK